MSFAEELGIRNHDLVAEHAGLEPIAGPDRYGRAYRHDGAGPRIVRDDPTDLVNLCEIGVSVGPHRRTDGDQNDVGVIELGIGLDEPDGRLAEQLPDARLPERILEGPLAIRQRVRPSERPEALLGDVPDEIPNVERRLALAVQVEVDDVEA